MPGSGGRGNSAVNAAETAKLLHRYKPFTIAAVATAVSPGSALARMRDAGEYTDLTEGEMLDEELVLLKALEMDDDCLFFAAIRTIPSR